MNVVFISRVRGFAEPLPSARLIANSALGATYKAVVATRNAIQNQMARTRRVHHVQEL